MAHFWLLLRTLESLRPPLLPQGADDQPISYLFLYPSEVLEAFSLLNSPSFVSLAFLMEQEVLPSIN